jgi:outer membrane lipoprotein-sorting protein
MAAPLFAATQEIPDSELAALKSWLATQKTVRSVSAEFTQTRALRTLRSPLASKGRLWFQAPDSFRWELGDPPKTILIGTPNGLTEIRPDARRAERKPAAAPGTMSDAAAMGMMPFPGAGSLEDFRKQVEIRAIKSSGSRCHLEFLPRDPRAVRGLAVIKLDFDTETGHWLRLEIVTREGSSIINEFQNVEINPKIPKGTFDFDLTGFKITDEKK